MTGYVSPDWLLSVPNSAQVARTQFQWFFAKLLSILQYFTPFWLEQVDVLGKEYMYYS